MQYPILFDTHCSKRSFPFNVEKEIRQWYYDDFLLKNGQRYKITIPNISTNTNLDEPYFNSFYLLWFAENEYRRAFLGPLIIVSNWRLFTYWYISTTINKRKDADVGLYDTVVSSDDYDKAFTNQP